MTTLAWAWSLALGALFIVSSVSKSLDARSFQQVLRYSLRINAATAQRLGLGIITVELVAGAVGVAGPIGPVAIGYFAATTGLLLAFTGWALWAIGHHLSMKCHCFGSRSGAVSQRTVLRNVAIIVVTVLALAGVASSDDSRAGVSDAATRSILAMTIGGLAAAFAAYRFARPLLMTSAEFAEKIATVEGTG